MWKFDPEAKAQSVICKLILDFTLRVGLNGFCSSYNRVVKCM